jgi:hypothetical protein
VVVVFDKREITYALVQRHRVGIPVRVLGDRVSIFEIDPLTRREFEYLATNGIPIRLPYNPTSFPYIMHLEVRNLRRAGHRRIRIG